MFHGPFRRLAERANRCAVALADRLGTPAVEFPGGHGGFMELPEQCGHLSREVLTAAA